MTLKVLESGQVQLNITPVDQTQALLQQQREQQAADAEAKRVAKAREAAQDDLPESRKQFCDLFVEKLVGGSVPAGVEVIQLARALENGTAIVHGWIHS